MEQVGTKAGKVADKTLKKTKKIKIPTSQTTYWRAKDKNPEYFVYTPDGNLGTILESGAKDERQRILEAPVKLLDLPIYAPVSREEIDTIWAERQARFETIYQDIEKARNNLRAALAAFQAGAGTPREVVIANQLVAEKEAELIANRSAKRWVENIYNPVMNTILLSQRYETRRLNYDAYDFKQIAIDPQNLLHVVSEMPGAGNNQVGGSLELVYGVIGDDTLLGLHWPADIKVGNTQYFTAFQAVLGEVARTSNNLELFQSILGTRSSRTLRTLTKDIGAEAYTPEILQSVITAISKQYPEFKEILLKTGDEHLVYANVLDTIFSVGLESLDPTIQDPKHWRGSNLWGEALEKARSEFRASNVVVKEEEEAISKAEEEPVENAVISKEEQEAKKKAAIINARRFHKNY